MIQFKFLNRKAQNFSNTLRVYAFFGLERLLVNCLATLSMIAKNLADLLTDLQYLVEVLQNGFLLKEWKVASPNKTKHKQAIRGALKIIKELRGSTKKVKLKMKSIYT